MAISPKSLVDQRRFYAGHGQIACSSYGPSIVFTELSSTYPLKLVAPKTVGDAVGIVYVMSYGGGLVSGDYIELKVDVEGGCKLLLLSQGSTKVYKTRPGDRLSTRLPGQSSQRGQLQKATTNVMDVTIAPGSAVFLLPDPVTCFRAASYTQTQRFHLSGDASLALLDWVTSGRKSLGEEWVFSRYYSVNEVFLDGHCIARDVMLLEDPILQARTEPSESQSSPRSLKDRLDPYSCYATLVLCGPLVHGVTEHLIKVYQSMTIFKTAAPARLIWSLSPINQGKAYVVRVAGKDTVDVKNWLRDTLRGFEHVVGIDAYLKVFV